MRQGDETNEKQEPSSGQGVQNTMVSSLVLKAAAGGGHHQLCFTRDENEARRGDVTCPRSQSQ